ncbi:MAG: DUF1926 domain-containing protein [Candidatus Margulisbacteria bacterium]|nr:DUF1926 domain-containing protein [Candidatus Margulisiibacteriota bacterium]
MKKVKFLFGVHCHQPIGNFEHILAEAYEKSYLPFIKAMEKHPKIKFAVHYSGILYDWFIAKQPEFIELLNKLAQRGQMEIFTAGYYEPVLPIIPDCDKIGQISQSNRFIMEHFNTAPRGAWLTERIWEPSLPKILAPLGIEYVTVDDYHFISAGLPPDKLFGYYITEDEGHTLKVFPINKNLRYKIPFSLPEETIKYLQEIKNDGTHPPAAILFDDGEKFGVWPGTYQWVFEEGYLENLLCQLENNADWIEFSSFADYVDEYPPLGRIYLPTASYFEMMEWSLFPEAGKKMEKITAELKNSGKFDEYSQFFKGGFFRNFLVKYPESNNMQKKMLYVSGKLQTLKSGKNFLSEKRTEEQLHDATQELYKGQCNCAYWHGVFGGLYLNYLRHAVYEHLIKAEAAIDHFVRGQKNFVDLSVLDFDKDGGDEILLSNNLLNVYLAPARGASIFELDYKPKAYNLTDTLARREEVYHSKIKEAHSTSAGGPGSIHGLSRLKEDGLDKILHYDWHPRLSLQDHFLGPDTTLEKFAAVDYVEAGNFTIEPYVCLPKKASSEVSVKCKRDGRVNGAPVRVEKNISLLAKQSIINIEYHIYNLGTAPQELWFGSEFNFSLLAGNSPDRFYVIPGQVLADNSLQSSGETSLANRVKVVDEWAGFAVVFEADKPANLWRFPIETISQSEGGMEKTYQSSVLLPNWKFRLDPQAGWTVKISLRVEE